MRLILILLAFQHLAAAPLPTGPGPYHLASGDLNGDGFPDLVAACRGELLLPTEARPANDTITVYFTQGTPELTLRRDYQTGFGPYTSAIADLDGDGKLDVAVVNFQANDPRHLTLFWGQAAEPFLTAQPIAIAGDHEYDKSRTNTGAPVYPSPGLTSVAAADFNRDGKTDLVAVAWSSDFFVVLENQGKRRFKQRLYPLPPGPRDVAVADFDRNGTPDLAFSIYSANLVELWLGDQQGRFRRSQTLHAQGHIPYHVKAADLDGDRFPELIAGNRGPSDNVVVFRNERGRLRFNGSYRTGTPKRGETTADEIRDVFLHDMDGDGHLDLLAAGHVSHRVILWPGTGRTGFGEGFLAPRHVEFPGGGPRAFAAVGTRIAVALFDTNETSWVPATDAFSEARR